MPDERGKDRDRPQRPREPQISQHPLNPRDLLPEAPAQKTVNDDRDADASFAGEKREPASFDKPDTSYAEAGRLRAVEHVAGRRAEEAILMQDRSSNTQSREEMCHAGTPSAKDAREHRRLISKFLQKVVLLIAIFGAGFFISALTTRPTENVTKITFPQHTEEKRFFMFTPGREYKVSDLIVPGRYTIIALSAEWCAPCRILRAELKRAAEHNQQLVVIDIDVSEARDTSHFSIAPFRLSSANISSAIGLPTMFVFDPCWAFTFVNSNGKHPLPPQIEGDQAARQVRELVAGKYPVNTSMRSAACSADNAVKRLSELEHGTIRYDSKSN